MNPLQDIDWQRFNFNGAFNPPGPTVNLPQIMQPIWQDFYHTAVESVKQLVRTNEKPSPNYIFTFNLLSQGNPPFVCEQMADLVTNQAVVYLGELRRRGLNQHDSGLAREVTHRLADMYAWAIVCNEPNLQQVVPPNLRQKCEGGLQAYSSAIHDAQNAIAPQPQNTGWGSSQNSGGGWGASQSNNGGWGATQSNTGAWDSAMDNDWDSVGTSNTTSQSGGWQDSAFGNDWDSGFTSAPTQQTNNLLEDEIMDDIDAAIADAYTSEKEKPKEQPAQPEQSQTSGWDNWNVETEEKSNEAPGWDMTPWDDHGIDDAVIDEDNSQVLPEADLNNVTASNSDYMDVEEIKDYLTTRLLLGEIKIEGGFTRYDNEDTYASILNAVLEGGGLPLDASTIQVDGKRYLGLIRHQVLEYTNLHLRRSNDVLTTKEVEYYYVIDGEGELFEMPIDISDHNIYRANTVDEDDVAKVVDLAYASTTGAGTTGSSKLDPDSVEFISAEVENFSDISPFLVHNIKDNDAIVASITYPLSTQIVVGDADKDYLSNINVKSLAGLKESVSTLNDNGHRNIGRMIANTFLLKCLKSELLRLDHDVTVPSTLAGLETLCDNDNIVKDMVNDIARSLRLILSVPEKDDPYTPVTVRLYAERNFMYVKNLESIKTLVDEGNKTWDVPTSVIPGIKGCMERLSKDYVSFDVFIEENTMLRVALTSPEHDWATFTMLDQL